MVIANGTLVPVTYTGGGFDENGNPVNAEEILGEEIPCCIQTDTHNRKGVSEDGTYSNQAYTVLIDVQEQWEAAWIHLYDIRQNYLGIFQIQDGQFLDCVGAIKLKVIKP